MARGRLAYNLERMFISMHKRHPALNGITLSHRDKPSKAAENEIVVSVTIGNRNLAGFGGYEFEATSFIRSLKDPERQATIADALAESIYKDVGTEKTFQWTEDDGSKIQFYIAPDGADDREEGQHLRTRRRAFSGAAVEKS
jgi:hypothetical protein